MTSKSQEKRVAAQSKAPACLKPQKWEIDQLTERLVSAEARVENLESQVVTLKKVTKELLGAFEYAANECRPIYGMGGLAIIFDAIVKKAKG